jgi:hypothetical protein
MRFEVVNPVPKENKGIYYLPHVEVSYVFALFALQYGGQGTVCVM